MKFFVITMLALTFGGLGMGKNATAADIPKFIGITESGSEVTVSFHFGTNSSFRLERAVGPNGVYQPFTPGEVLGVEFPSPGVIVWRLDTIVLGTRQRTFRVVIP